MQKLPSISIITPTYNCDLALFEKVLKSIKQQDYPKHFIEHTIIDGGSTNPTISLAKKYGCNSIVRPELLIKTQERLGIGILRAKYELILILEADNILIGHDWLLKMVEPFKDPDISYTYSMYNGYEEDMPLLTKYFALFGVNDIFLYYLGKTEKMPLDSRGYDKGTTLEEKENYFKVQFEPGGLPPLGDNGIMVRANILKKITEPSTFIHVDAIYALVLNGYNKFGVVKNSIIHYCGGNIYKQYKNRVLIKHRFYDTYRGYRIYLTFNPHSVREILNTFFFCLYSVTIVVPLVRSIKGYLKVREIAWFLNPIVCLIAFFMYAFSEINFQITKKNTRTV